MKTADPSPGGRRLTPGMLKLRQDAPLAPLKSTARLSAALCETVARAINELTPVPARVTIDSVAEDDPLPQGDDITPIEFHSAAGNIAAYVSCDRPLVFALTDLA